MKKAEIIPAGSAALGRPLPSSAVPPAVSFLAGFSGESLRAMRGSLQVIARLFAEQAGAAPGTFEFTDIPWATLERGHVRRIRELLSERYKPATARRHFAALRGVLVEAGNTTAVAGVKGPKGESEEKGRALSREEIDSLFDACELWKVEGGVKTIDFRAAQARALLAVGYAGGLRRFEIAALDTMDYADGVLTVRRGKGKKARRIALSPRACEVVETWLSVRGGDPGPMFYGRNRERVSGATVAARLAGLQSRAGIKKFSPHDLRRTFVTRILEKTGDLSAAQKLAGHASSTTTARYDKRDQKTLDEVSIAIDEE